MLPADYRQTFEKLSPAAQQAWLEQRLRGQIDHLYLGVELMGYDFQPNPHEALFREFLGKDPEQKKALHELDPKTRKRMILWSRGLFKTSGIIVAIVQLILNFPNIRILILSGSKPLTKRQLGRAKKVFEKPSAKFRQLYPEFCAPPGEKLGDSEEFTVPCRTLDQLAEPTVCISTAKSVKAGSHFDVIFVDDLVNDQNYKSPKLLEKCWQDYCDIGPLLEPAGYMFITGTPYAPGDTYELIEEAAKREQQETGSTVWKFSMKSCWIRFCKTCRHPDLRHDSDRNYTAPPCTMPGCECKCFVDSGEKQVLFPLAITRDGRQVGHTVEFLESERREKGEEFFALQYECRRTARDAKAFTPELLDAQTFFHLKVIPVDAGTIMVGDLSYIGQQDRDLSVLFLLKVFMGGLWLYDCIAGKWDSDEAATNILGGMLKHRPQAIWIEAFLGWEAYNNVIMSKAASLGILQVPLAWIPMNNKKDAKMVRIGGIISWLKQKKLWLFRGLPDVQVMGTRQSSYDLLRGQLKKWPQIGKRRDFADCLGLAVEAPHGAAVLPAPKSYSPMDHIRQLHADNVARQQADKFDAGGTGSGIVSG